jgi:hypothetical protein
MIGFVFPRPTPRGYDGGMSKRDRILRAVLAIVAIYFFLLFLPPYPNPGGGDSTPVILCAFAVVWVVAMFLLLWPSRR